MKRNCSLDEISDGKLYNRNDMVKASCNGCNGIASCCQGMGTSIILDPYDIYQLTTHMKYSFEELLASNIELNVVDGVVLPNLKMTGANERCTFLDENGRCSIHIYRPGICRIFPLGRIYDNHDFNYILQIHECKNKNRTKVKVGKWIDTPEFEKNKNFLIWWHYFLNAIEEKIKNTEDETEIRNYNLFVLNQFFVMPYDGDKDFYEQFEERREEAKKLMENLN